MAKNTTPQADENINNTPQIASDRGENLPLNLIEYASDVEMTTEIVFFEKDINSGLEDIKKDDIN
jgi:hypothetical protein